jgi:hypothetical protein
MNGIAGPRQVIAYLGNLGSSLPTAVAQHRSNFFWKRAAGAEDELYAGVRDSSGVNQLRRILTKTYADTLYLTEAAADALYEPALPVPWLHWMQGLHRSIAANTLAATFSTANVGAPTVTSPTAASNADASDGAWVQVATAASTNSVASVELALDGAFRREWAPAIVFVIKDSGTVTSIREWIGAFTSTPSGSADPSGIGGAGFFWDSVTGGNWRVWTNDASGTGTFANTGIAHTGGDAVRFMMVFSDSDIAFYMSTTADPEAWTLVHTATTDLPVAATVLLPSVYVTALANSSRVMRVSRISLIHER